MPALRPLIWRLLLNFLPTQTSDWTKTIESQRITYENFRRELILEPELKHAQNDHFKSLRPVEDHPLSLKKDSIWNKYHEDKDIWEEIEKDIKRTRSEIGFFTRPVERRLFSEAEERQLQI